MNATPARAQAAPNAAAIAVGPDNRTHLLWNNPDASAAVWDLAADGTVATQSSFGPFSGWSAPTLAAGPDGLTHLLWANTDGTANPWTLSASGTYVSDWRKGPYAGYLPTAVLVGTDNQTRLLLDKTDGSFVVFRVDSTGALLNAYSLGPYPGYTALSLAVDPSGDTRLLLRKTDGSFVVFQVDASGTLLDAYSLGPFTGDGGYRVRGLAASADGNTRLLLVAGAGKVVVYTVTATGALVSAYALVPPVGYGPVSLSVGGDNVTRLLWNDGQGDAQVWTVAADGTYTAKTYSAGASAPVADLSTYATGSGKITLYWTPVANATGYNVYRGTSAGGEDYTHPVNGATPVTAASYSGSPMDMYSDTGLSDGTEYFYTVKAVYGNGQSQASNEDSDIPDPVDVPWDTRNPGAILSAIRSDFSDDTNNIGTDPFSLRAVGPDGTIYDDNFSTAQPPDGTIDAASSQLIRPDGSTQTLPNDDGELYIAPSSAAITQSLATGTPAKRPNGPIRRVTTSPNYRGADGYFALPITSTNSQAAIANGDAATIYLGVVGQKLAVDAGVVYSDKTGWGLEMLITGHVHGIVGQPNPNSKKPIIPEVKLVNAPIANIRFSSGSTVRMTYWAWSNMKKIAHQKLSLLVVDDVDNGFAGALAGPASALGKQENVAAKRVHSIAQNQLGVTPTGSKMDNCAWDQGQVILPGTSNISQVWNAPITTEDLKYDGGNSSVTATELSPYTAESNISIDIKP